MEYIIQIYNAADSTWLTLDVSFTSYERARAHLDELLSRRQLSSALHLPAGVKIIPKEQPCYLDHPASHPWFRDEGNTASDHNPSKFWTHVSDIVSEDDDALDLFLELTICEDFTDEDAEIAAAWGLDLAYFNTDWRDAVQMANLTSGDDAQAYLGDEIDNAIAFYLA